MLPSWNVFVALQILLRKGGGVHHSKWAARSGFSWVVLRYWCDALVSKPCLILL